MNAPLALTADPPAADPQIETRFRVPGMRCAGCIAKLESALPKQPGIAAARVHFGVKQLTLTHAAGLTVPALIAAIDAAGFEAQPLQSLDGKAPDEVRPLLLALAVASFAAMNIMLLSVANWSGAGGGTRQLFHWISALIAIPAIAYAGRPFFASAWRALRRRQTNMDVPISIGLILTTAMSLFETITGGHHAWFDGATMLCAFLLGGRVLDASMRARAVEAVGALLAHAPAGAQVLDAGGTARWVAAADLVPGMMMLVAAGERLATDALVMDGYSRLDRSLITGESASVPVAPGDGVDAGTLNRDAPLTVRVERAAEDSSLADIARLMEAAGQARSRYMRIADRAARLYAPAVHTLAALSFAGWMLAGAGWHQSLLIAVAVLLITCPCALGLAVPVAQVVASGAMMRAGLMVKDGSALERLATVTRVLLDKTGTLTRGEPVPQALDALSDAERSVALALAQASRHPLSTGLARALRGGGTVPATLTQLAETAGQGMTAQWQGQRVALERPATATDGMATSLAIGTAPPRLIAFADPLRADVPDALAQLHALGLSASILSGDTLAGVAGVARDTGLFAQASARPEDKIAAVKALEATGERVLMVGDGLNDGPALAAATAAIAPGSASDVGRQAADIVFLGEGLSAVPIAIRAAQRTQAVVRQNLGLAILYNIVAVPLAIAGYVTPLIAALAMSGSSAVVVANALRLRGAAR